MDNSEKQAIDREIERRQQVWAMNKISNDFSSEITKKLIDTRDTRMFLVMNEADLIVDHETNQTLLITGYESDRETPILETIESRISSLEKQYPERFLSSRESRTQPNFFKWAIKSTTGWWIFKKTVTITGFYSEEEAKDKAIALNLKNFTVEKV